VDTVVVAVDGSSGAQEALRFAAREASLHGAALRLVCAWEVPPAALSSLMAGREFYEEFRDAATTVVDEAEAWVAEHEPTVKCEKRVVEGQAGKVVLAEAEGADLVVVGRRGHGGFAELLLGSISRQVVHHARCPVVIVPPPVG